MHRRQRTLLISLLAAVCVAAPIPTSAQTLAHKNWAGSGLVVAPWWVGAELYALDPISFQDSDGDGFGDLAGITTRLDYLAALGIDAIVLSPMPLQASGAPSPFDKAYGTEEDFGHLVEEATRRRMRLLVELPLTTRRTSDETLGTARFWLTRGVAGFKLVHDPVRNNQDGPGNPDSPGNSDSPDQHSALTPAERAERIRALRRLCGEFAGQRVLIGEQEVPVASSRTTQPRSFQPRTARQGPQGVQMIVERGPALAGVHASALRSALIAAERLAGEASTPVLLTDAADQPRSIDRLGDGLHNLAIARIVAATLLASRGAPMLYFGQELGMSGTMPAPMPWTGEHAEHGFTTGTPWIEPSPNADTTNVAAEDADPDSLLNWYRKLGTLRRQNAALRQGSEAMLQAGDPDAIAWVRHARLGESETPDVVVVLNCSSRFVSVSVAEGIGTRVLRTLAATFAADTAVSSRALAIPPFGVYIGQVQRKAGLETQPDPPRRHR